MCTKVSLGYREAHQLLNDMKHRHLKTIPKRVYFCKEHKQWHLTSKPLLGPFNERRHKEMA